MKKQSNNFTEKILKSDAADNKAESRAVGAEIRVLRKARNLTLAILAERCEMSIGYLSQLERGLSSPTIQSLHIISQALGVTPGFLFHDDTTASPEEKPYVVRAHNRRAIQYTGQGMTDELLVPDLGGKLQMLMCTLDPGAEYRHSGDDIQGEVVGLIIEGCVECWIDEKHFVLNSGDSIRYQRDDPYLVRNSFDHAARIILAITPPWY